MNKRRQPVSQSEYLWESVQTLAVIAWMIYLMGWLVHVLGAENIPL